MWRVLQGGVPVYVYNHGETNRLRASVIGGPYNGQQPLFRQARAAVVADQLFVSLDLYEAV